MPIKKSYLLQVWYKVRWKGYTPDHDSWVKETEMLYREPIEAFEKNLLKMVGILHKPKKHIFILIRLFYFCRNQKSQNLIRKK